MLAVRDQERAGIDIISDGEMRRESYSNRFATASEGSISIGRDIVTSRQVIRCRSPGHRPLERLRPVEVRDVSSCAPLLTRAIKITVPGPFTMAQQASNEFYETDAAMALAYAESSTRRSGICSPPERTSCRWTSPTCRRARTRRGRMGWRR